MTARVITDPSALGWVLDPDTGRWEWSGSGDGDGSGGGGGGAWELLEKLSGSDVSAFEFDLDTTEFHAYRFFVDILPSGSLAELWVQLGSNGSMITASEYTTEFFDQRKGNGFSGTTKQNVWYPTKNVTYENAAQWELKLASFGNKPTLSFSGASGQSTNDTHSWFGAGSLNYRSDLNGPIDKVKIFPKSNVTWTGSITMEGMRN